MTLRVIPISLQIANAFVQRHHRHHGATVGHRFSLGCLEADRLCGVAIMGRPVARMADDGWSLEVTRCCTDGTRNACSALYGACRRTAQAMGYARILTYTLIEEQGASLRGAGWTEELISPGGEWDRPSRPTKAARNPQPKRRWSCTFAPMPEWSPEEWLGKQIGQPSLFEEAPA